MHLGNNVERAVEAGGKARGRDDLPIVRESPVVDDRGVRTLSKALHTKVYVVEWTADGRRFALTVAHADHIGLWNGSAGGDVTRIDDLALNPLMGLPWAGCPTRSACWSAASHSVDPLASYHGFESELLRWVK